MAIMIREYLGHEGIHVDFNNTAINSIQESAGAGIGIKSGTLLVDIEGIHVGPTRNFTWYTEEALRDSVPTWTRPYLRPLIMHHNEKDGRIIGRIVSASYTDVNTRSGTGALVFTANVPDKEGIEGVENGTLRTVSIGAIVHDVRCSICGQNIAQDGECEHERGQQYDGKVCYWMIYKMEAKELSYVIVPSDVYAHNVRVYKPTTEQIKEFSKGVFSVSEAAKIDPNTGLPIQEGSQVIDENGNKPAEQTPPAAPTEDVEALKAKISKLEGEKDTLEKQVTDLEKEKSDALEAEKKAKSELDNVNVLLGQAQKEVKSAKDNLIVKEAEMIQVNRLREAAEDNLIKANAQIKEALVEKVIMLREMAGKPVIAKEELQKRNEESLNDSIKDLQEEVKKPAGSVSVIETPINPAIIEEKPLGDVKESKNKSNIDLEEGLQNLFSTVFSVHNKF